LKDFTVLFLQTKGDFRRYKSFKILQNSSIVYLDFIVPGNNDLFIVSPLLQTIGSTFLTELALCLKVKWIQ